MSSLQPAPRPMRRADRRLPDAEALTLLASAEWGVLATVGDDNLPYGVPISFALLPGEAGEADDLPHIVFHAALEGRKLDNLARNPEAMLTVVGPTRVLPAKFSTEYQSAMASGPVELLTDPAEKTRALLALAAKYSPGFETEAQAYVARALAKTAVLRLRTRLISGKARRPAPDAA